MQAPSGLLQETRNSRPLTDRLEDLEEYLDEEPGEEGEEEYEEEAEEEAPFRFSAPEDPEEDEAPNCLAACWALRLKLFAAPLKPPEEMPAAPGRVLELFPPVP